MLISQMEPFPIVSTPFLKMCCLVLKSFDAKTNKSIVRQRSLITLYIYNDTNDNWTLPNDQFDHDEVLHSILITVAYKIFFQLPINPLFHPLFIHPHPKEHI